MFGPEHGSGRHGTHYPPTLMPKVPKPEQMTPDERNSEVAEHFARAFIRARFPALSPAVMREESHSPETQKEPCNQN